MSRCAELTLPSPTRRPVQRSSLPIRPLCSSADSSNLEQVYNFTVMRILKDSGLTPPTPSVSSALASSSTSEWRTYQRSDTFFSRDTFNDVEVLKQLLPKAAGGGGGTRRKKKGASSDSDESD